MKLLAPVLAAFPKFQLLCGPTPLTPLKRLSAELGGPNIFIKRDDCSPLALGGNKTRKLEYVLGDACAQGADMLISCGAPQSNHARQTAAAAAIAGLDCSLLLAPWPDGAKGTEYSNGNVLLDQLLGASIIRRSHEQGMSAELEAIMARYRSEGRSPYFISAGASSALGSLGYVACAAELSDQMAGLGQELSSVVHATGSCGTQAGLLAGFSLLCQSVRVMGVAVSPDTGQAFRTKRVSTLCDEIFTLLEYDHKVPISQIQIEGGYCGPDYGVADEATLEAIKMTARLEGVLIDPVYTGKAMAALIAGVRAGLWRSNETVVFLHTGGAVALFTGNNDWSKSESSGGSVGQFIADFPDAKQTVDQIS